MPSHLEEHPDKARPSWVTADHIAGNLHADRPAIIAASQVEHDINAVLRVMGNTKLVSFIQHRLAAILCCLPHRKHDRRPHSRGNTRISTKQLMESTLHTLVKSGGGGQVWGV